jgi:hypothetical protein
MHEQASQFIEALKKNAASAWTDPDDDCILNALLYIQNVYDGSVCISDNFEKFFSYVYRVDAQGNWFIRDYNVDEPEKPYTFHKAMLDASIMYTG